MTDAINMSERERADRLEAIVETMAAKLVEKDARIAELEAACEALGKWKCQKCGCRFAELPKMPEGMEDMLDDVTHCSSCANAEGLAHRIAALEAEVITGTDAELAIAHARIAALEAAVERLHKTPCEPGHCDREECWIRACRAAGVLARVVRQMKDEDRARIMSLGVDALEARDE